MKQDDPGESDLPMEVAKASTPGACRGGLQETRNRSRSLSEAQVKHRRRGRAKGDYRSCAARSGDVASRWPTSLAWNAPICVLTNEARDPWERPGGTAFPPSLNDRKELF